MRTSRLFYTSQSPRPNAAGKGEDMSEQNATHVRPAKVFQFAGTLVGTLIGSGFASGQEVMQFFTSYGIPGIAGSLVTTALFAVLGAIFMNYGYKHAKSADFSSFRFFCGKYVGTFLEWFTILFCFLVGIIMISGAGATFNQYFGLPQFAGSVLMAAIALASALLGMNRIVKVLGSIGPVAIVFLIVIALAALFTNWDNLSNADAAIAAAGDSVVRGVGDSSSWWIVGAVMYVAYNILAGVPFISKMGTEAASQKEAILGGLFGGVLLGLCAFCLNLAMLATYSDVSVQEVPALQFATMISPVVGIVFAIVLLIMIYNTIVPMIISVANQFSSEEKDPVKYKGIIVALALVMLVGGQLPFSTLVNVIYPFVGYFGIAFMVIILVQYIRWHFSSKKSE